MYGKIQNMEKSQKTENRNLNPINAILVVNCSQ